MATRSLRKIQPLAEEVHAHHDVVDAGAQVVQDLDALEGDHLGVEVVDVEPRLAEVLGEVLGHPLGEGGDQGAFAALDAPAGMAIRSSIWPLVGRTMTSGSTSPVGRMICSTTWALTVRSYSAASPRRTRTG